MVDLIEKNLPGPDFIHISDNNDTVWKPHFFLDQHWISACPKTTHKYRWIVCIDQTTLDCIYKQIHYQCTSSPDAG